MGTIASKRRETEVFSMAFLDCICCGFGAVILIFILTLTKKVNIDEADIDAARAQAAKISESIQVDKDATDAALRAMAAAQLKLEETNAATAQERLKLTNRQKELALMLQQTSAVQQAIDNLLGEKDSLPTSDIPSVAIPNLQLRQYISGLNLGNANSQRSERILFLVRASGSMLGETIADAAALLAATDDVKRAAPKWQRTIKSVQWLVAMLDPKTRFQIVLFSDDAQPLLGEISEEWYARDDKKAIGDMIKALEKVVPRGSANLERAFTRARRMLELPDSIILITDSLPTSSDSFLTKGEVSEEDRRKLFDVAVRALPRSIPVSTILMPLTGDPGGPWSYWKLATDTKGTVISPARDWPDI